MPFKLKNKRLAYQKDHFNALETPNGGSDERKALGDSEGQEYERRFPEEKAHLQKLIEEETEPIKICKFDRTKPVAVIYNPTSGKQKDIRNKIRGKVEQSG